MTLNNGLHETNINWLHEIFLKQNALKYMWVPLIDKRKIKGED